MIMGVGRGCVLGKDVGVWERACGGQKSWREGEGISDKSNASPSYKLQSRTCHVLKKYPVACRMPGANVYACRGRIMGISMVMRAVLVHQDN